MRVDAGADGGAAERNEGELFSGVRETPQRLVHLSGVSEEHLAQADRRGVLKVGASRLDHPQNSFDLAASLRAEDLDRRLELLVDRQERRDVRARWG